MQAILESHYPDQKKNKIDFSNILTISGIYEIEPPYVVVYIALPNRYSTIRRLYGVEIY
jgi:hypothetical protein